AALTAGPALRPENPGKTSIQTFSSALSVRTLTKVAIDGFGIASKLSSEIDRSALRFEARLHLFQAQLRLLDFQLPYLHSRLFQGYLNPGPVTPPPRRPPSGPGDLPLNPMPIGHRIRHRALLPQLLKPLVLLLRERLPRLRLRDLCPDRSQLGNRDLLLS